MAERATEPDYWTLGSSVSVLLDAAEAISRACEKRLVPLGLSFAQHRLLAQIQRAGGPLQRRPMSAGSPPPVAPEEAKIGAAQRFGSRPRPCLKALHPAAEGRVGDASL